MSRQPFLVCGQETFTHIIGTLSENGSQATSDETAPKGYVCLVDHALAQSEVGVWQVGQSLQQNLGGHVSLEVGGIKLVPAEENTKSDLTASTLHFCSFHTADQLKSN